MGLLHALALGPAVLAVACTPARGRGGRAAVATGLLMLVAMADVAFVPAGVPDLVWSAVLLAAAVALAGLLRHRAPDGGENHPGHRLHVGCLLAMAVLIAAMAGPGAAGPGAASPGHHHGADSLTVLGLGAAAAFVVASCVVAAGARRRTVDRVGALAGAGSAALMAAAVVA
ncbi:hypothetical protein [Promicromonospora soli]|uniref:DUF5134 domain-containing protein n=1 Tax=Promicromonospora soli TaxID=2035533 RepID=A0A919FKH3_9MICO|nr:hypothetical protein [Promicromonospora soli]GHH67368.1 hypothetical protein GCM10017772_09000 [Promicromonospora soli]